MLAILKLTLYRWLPVSVTSQHKLSVPWTGIQWQFFVQNVTESKQKLTVIFKHCEKLFWKFCVNYR